MPNIKAKLRSLRVRRPTAQEIDELHKQIAIEQNDRGAAILSTTLVENGLSYAITRRMPSAGKCYDKLFDNNGIFSSLDARITIACALEIFSLKTLHNLELIKHIRNTFAHANVPITFSTPEIQEACDALHIPTDLIGSETSRHKFVATCYSLSHDLMMYAARMVYCRADLIEPASMVPVIPQPLP